jgi:TolA-binding protein
VKQEKTDPDFARKLVKPMGKSVESPTYSFDEPTTYSGKQNAPILPPTLKSIQLDAEIQANYELERITDKEIYLYDFKFIDYRGQRFMPADPVKELHGTSAEREKKSKSESAMIEDRSPTANTIPYHDFLNETARLMKSADYATALVNYKRILITYPADDNALFYAGFCLFQLGNYKQAMVYFNQSESSVRINFQEEAEWYIFKCYLRIEDSAKAKKQGLKVIARNGHYKKEAENLVKQLN